LDQFIRSVRHLRWYVWTCI